MLKEKLLEKRALWVNVRNERLALKRMLLDSGMNIIQVRRERAYALLKKKQKRLSVQIKHIEKKINRLAKRERCD